MPDFFNYSNIPSAPPDVYGGVDVSQMNEFQKFMTMFAFLRSLSDPTHTRTSLIGTPRPEMREMFAPYIDPFRQSEPPRYFEPRGATPTLPAGPFAPAPMPTGIGTHPRTPNPFQGAPYSFGNEQSRFLQALGMARF